MKNYTKIKNWKLDQYKNFALARGFVLPEYPSDEELLAMSSTLVKRTKRNGPCFTSRIDEPLSNANCHQNKGFVVNFIEWATKKHGSPNYAG